MNFDAIEEAGTDVALDRTPCPFLWIIGWNLGWPEEEYDRVEDMKNQYKDGRRKIGGTALDNINGIPLNKGHQKGRVWANNGVQSSLVHTIPDGWVKGRLKQVSPTKGTHYWNDGVTNKRSKSCPGPGWVLGRINWRDKLPELERNKRGQFAGRK